MKTALQKAIDAHARARTSLIDHMRACFPKGTVIGFHIAHGQKNESTGVVLSHFEDAGFAYLRVAHDQAKPNSRYRYRSVLVQNARFIRGIQL